MTSGVAGIVLVGYMLRSMVPRRRGAHGGIVLAYAAAPALHDLVQEIASAPLPPSDDRAAAAGV